MSESEPFGEEFVSALKTLLLVEDREQLEQGSQRPEPDSTVTPESVIRSFKRGSPLGFIFLIPLMNRRPDLVPEILDVLFHHISMQVPDVPDPKSQAIHIGSTCISVLTIAIGSPPTPDKYHVAAEISKHWDDLYRWLHYIITRIVEPELEGWEREFNQIVQFLASLTYLTFEAPDCDHVRSKLLQHPDMMYLMTRLLMHRGRRDTLVPIMSSMLFVTQSDFPETVNFMHAIIRALRDIPASLTIIIDTIAKAKQKSASVDVVQVSAAMALPLCIAHRWRDPCENLKEVRTALLAGGVIQGVCALLSSIVENTEPTGDVPIALTHCTTFLRDFFILFNHDRFITEAALRGGLFSPLARLSKQLAHSNFFGVDDLVARNIGAILQIVTPFLAFPSVLELAIHDFERIGELPYLDKSAPYLETLQDRWDLVARLLSLRKKQKETYDSSWEEPCAGPDCNKKLKWSSLKRCSGCSAVHYCSPECQRKHWKSKHSQECKKLAATHSDMSYRTRSFLSWMVRNELITQRFDVVACFRDLQREHPRTQFVYCGGCSFPTKASCKKQGEFLQDIDDDYKEQATVIAKERKSDNDFLVYQFFPYRGGAHHVLFWASTVFPYL